jgi:tRNA A58 N-methylase Trm61
MSSIQWIDSSSPGLSEDDDILHRVVRHPGQSADRFFASGNSTFDVVILDQPPSPKLVLQVAERLTDGGVLAVALPDPWEHVQKQVLSVFTHVHLFTPYDSDGKSS